MDYELQILRNNEPVADKDTAIALLDKFKYHRIGQLVSIIYYEDDNTIGNVLAIGVKNSDEVSSGELTYGSSFYKIIGNSTSDGEIPTYEIENELGNLVATGNTIRHIVCSQDIFDDWVFRTSSNLAFTKSTSVDGKSGGRIYVSGELYGTTYLDDMTTKDTITLNGEEVSGTFEEIINKISNSSSWVDITL